MIRRNCIIFFMGLGFGIALACAFVTPYSGELKLSYLMLQLSGSRGDFALGTNLTDILSFVVKIFPYFIFELYMGTELYQNFCTASVYVFSRTPHRLCWYFKEILSIAISALFYQTALTLMTAFFASHRYQLEVDLAGIYLFLLYFFIYFFWNYAMTLLVNLIAVYLGSDSAFQIIVNTQLVMISLLIVIETMKAHQSLVTLYINLNPFSRMVLGWHTGSKVFEKVLNSPYSGLYFYGSLLYMILLSAVSVIFGGWTVKTHDFLNANIETEAS